MTEIQIFDSISGDNKVLSLRTVRLYVCGPTVYDDAHLGHARTYITFDIIRRILSDYFNYTVIYAMNIRDVDDKIIRKTVETHGEILDNTDFKIKMNEISETYTRKFFDSMDSISISRPDYVLKVTEHIKDIIDFIQSLLNDGYAYISDDGVYFDIDKYEEDYDYYQLVNPDHISDEQNTNFVLWKLVKNNEPYWNSPWGTGRPGWHIECSTLADKVFPKNITIHGGSIDLKFPHHNNEIAQSTALYAGEYPWTDIFMHVNHLSIKGRKMSISLKNFITVDEFVEKYNPTILRLMFLVHHWSDPMELDLTWGEDDTVFINHIVKLNNKISDFMIKLQNFIHRNRNCQTNSDEKLLSNLEISTRAIDEALRNNFNTPAVFIELEKIMKDTNKYLNQVEIADSVTLNVIYKFMLKIFGLFGIKIKQINFKNTQEDFDSILSNIVNVRKDLQTTLKDSYLSPSDKLQTIWNISDKIREILQLKYNIKIEDGSKIKYYRT